MNLASLTVMLADASAPAMQPSQTAQTIQFMVTVGLLIVAFYFLMIRPQSKKAREHANMLKTIRPGDKVITSSGIIATVVSVKEKSVAIRSADTKIEVLKSAITEITDRSGESTTVVES